LRYSRTRAAALKAEIKKYQLAIRETRQKMENLDRDGNLTEDARSNYRRILRENSGEERKLQEDLAEIYAKSLPPLKEN
jgi:competence protein ComGC